MKQLSKLVLLLLIAGFTASAQDGKKMTFQGSLFQADQPFNGTAKLEFAINIDSANNWTETITEVNVINGLYSVVLGETNPLPSDLFYMSSERTLMIKVDDVELGDVVLYSPFATASPYELPDVIDVDTLYAYALSIGTDSTDNVYLDSNGDGYFAGDLLVEGEINSASELNTALNDTTGVHFNADGNGILTGNLDVGSLTMNGEPFIPEVQLPLDMAGPNGNRSVMLSSEGENGNDGTFRLADSLGRSRVTLFANKFNSDSLSNRTYTGAGGAWFGSANGSMGANISSDGPENSNGFLELGDKSGITQARLSINESAEGVTSGALSLRGSDGSEMNLSSRGMNLNRLDMFDSLDRLGLTLTRRTAGGGLLHFPSVTDDFTYNWIQNRVLEDGSAQGSAQVANIASDGSYVTGTGMSGGFFYIDSWANEQFYTNVELGLTQEGTKLPYMHLRGSEPINWSDDQGTPSDSTDDTSGSYLPNLVSLETQRNEDGVEKGRINLTGTAGFSHNMEDWIDEIRNDDGSGTYSQQRNSVFRVRNDNDQFSAVFLNRFDDGQTRLQLASHDAGGANQGITFVGANADGGYSYIGTADPTNTLRAGMYVGDNLPHLFMQGTFDVQGDINADSLGNLTDTTYYRPEYVNLDVHHNDDGDEYGALTLRGSDGSEFHVSSRGIEGMNTRSKKFELENDEDDRLVGDMTSNSNGGQLNIGGIIDTSDTTFSYGGGISTGTKFWESTPQLGYFHLRGSVNEANYFGANLKFTLEAVTRENSEEAEFKMYGSNLDGNSSAKVVLQMNSALDQSGQSAAEITGDGPSSPNFFLGAKTWEDNGANRAYFRMNGANEVSYLNDNGTPDSTGDDFESFYHPELVVLDIHNHGDGNESGNITLRSTDGKEIHIGPYGIEGLESGFQNKEFVIQNDNSDEQVGNIVGLQNGSQINLGGLLNTSDTTTSYGGGFSAGTKFWEGNPQLGYIHLRGTVNEANYFDANMKFAMEAVADGDQERAEFKMFGNDLDGNNAAKTVLWMNSTMDQNGQSAAEIRSEGSSSPNFTLGAKTWEDNGANMPFLRMNGDMEVPGDTIDTVATFYHPDLVWLEVQKWENGTELGSFMLRGTDGSEFGINSHGFTGKVNDIDASHLNADTHLQVGDFFGSDGREGLYVSQDGYIDAAGASLRGNLYVQASRITETDNAGNEFYPNIAGLEVHQWGDDPNTGEVEPDIDVAHLSLKSSDGSESNMNAYGLTSGNNNMNLNVNSKELALDVQGAQYANIGIGIDDGSPNSNNGGTLNLGGASQTSGIRAYGEFIDGEGTSLSHMALDDNSGSYVYLWGSGSVDASGSVNAPSINQTSDARFKKDVNAIEGALAKVQKLNGYTYFWNRTAKKVKGINDESEQIGVIAQELEEIFPQLVNTDANGYKSVNYASMTAVLIEAVKELNAKVENLETENTDLKAQVESSAKLESRLAQIEKLLGVKTNETSSANNK